MAGHYTDREPWVFDSICPPRNVIEDYPPTLLLHSDNDTDISFEQSKMMAKELKHQAIQHELFTISCRGHGFDRETENPEIVLTLDSILKFLDGFLKA